MPNFKFWSASDAIVVLPKVKEINWSLIDSHLIDMLIPALNPNTKLILYNCNSLTEVKIEILENLYPFLYQVDIKAKGKKDNSYFLLSYRLFK